LEKVDPNPHEVIGGGLRDGVLRRLSLHSRRVPLVPNGTHFAPLFPKVDFIKVELRVQYASNYNERVVVENYHIIKISTFRNPPFFHFFFTKLWKVETKFCSLFSRSFSEARKRYFPKEVWRTSSSKSSNPKNVFLYWSSSATLRFSVTNKTLNTTI